eukprot:TRINITY_DN38630_c0_g1_i1.p1 TRINITY_DN38630_c0_g1~~TRINITY_DN38630_c0_g1_i1.p1  ORF type:complete len:429 (+),score=127.86 TRINITY_DN38630_c0_g1_i1:113-1399(+)
MKGALICVGLLALVATASAKVYFEEKFDDTWEQRWTVSDWKQADGTAGQFIHSAGTYFADEEADKGIKTTPDARFFAISAPLTEELSNKDKELVLQFQVKHEQKMDCGGGYIKLLEGEVDPKSFGGDTPYSLMFGPDICGYSTKRVHAIITHKGKNLLLKPTVECETDELSHVYTWIIKPDNTYQILIDGEEKKTGSLYDDWEFLLPKKIKDPSAKKPKDWVDSEMMDDPEDKKPDGYDDIPAEIVDPEATKPEDWNDEEDGEWEAPTMPNPDYKGEWKAKKIKNPAYKGKWVAPEIDNPDFVDNKEVYLLPTLKHVGFELWQVKSGTIFDNILVTDDAEYAEKFRNETWGKMKDIEKEKFEAEKAARDAEEEAKRKEEEADQEKDEDSEDEEDYAVDGEDEAEADALAEEEAAAAEEAEADEAHDEL